MTAVTPAGGALASRSLPQPVTRTLRMASSRRARQGSVAHFVGDFAQAARLVEGQVEHPITRVGDTGDVGESAPGAVVIQHQHTLRVNVLAFEEGFGIEGFAGASFAVSPPSR